MTDTKPGIPWPDALNDFDRALNGIKPSGGKMAKRRAEMKVAIVEGIRSGELVDDVLKRLHVKRNTYAIWRRQDAEFLSNINAAKLQARGMVEVPRDVIGQGSFDFAVERELYFRHESPPFQLEMIEAIQTAKPGDIVMVLLPPEHGKTTLFEDYACLKLGHEPNWMFHVGSQAQSMSKKILRKVKARMNPIPGHFHWRYVHALGPFAPQVGEKRDQPWNEDHFDVYRKASAEADDRDYSMAALGFGSQIIGSRSLHLHCDDLQSRKNLSQTARYMEEFRQDWLSRPGETGITTIFGNRVDNGDIYEAVEEAFPPDILRIIRYPAILPNGEPLFPGRWTIEKLDRMRVKVTDPVWERNWMQNPRSKRFATFDEERIDRCKDPAKTFRDLLAGRDVWVGLDPALGGRNAVVAVAPSKAGIEVVAMDEELGLTTNEAIMGMVERMVVHLQARGARVTDVIIESMNFQQGLSRDERLLAMRDQYGFSVREHKTGVNKYDENIGVPSLAHTVNKRELVLPYGEDDNTRRWVDALRNQMLAWKPGKRGTQLRQDLLMALWFSWIRWRSMDKDTEIGSGDEWKGAGLPYGRHRSGLIVPTKYTPMTLGARR